MSRVTLKDVAKQAGVSVASVSNVLNGKTSKVTEETAKHILLVAQQMKYSKNPIAAALKSGTTNTILILLPTLDKTRTKQQLLQDNPFFTDFLSGIEKATSQNQLSCSFVRVSEAHEIDSIVNGPSPKGVITLGNLSDTVLEKIASWPFRTIMVDNVKFFNDYSANDNLINYYIDDHEMGSLAINHLFECGHKNIVLLFGRLSDSAVHLARYQGVVDKRQSINGDMKLTLIETELSIDAVRDVFPKIKNTIEDAGATAVLCMADILAIGCMQAASQHKLNIPGDFSLMGMDNLKLLDYLPYRLTTIDQNIVNRGFHAVQKIINEHEIFDYDFNVIEGETVLKV